MSITEDVCVDGKILFVFGHIEQFSFHYSGIENMIQDMRFFIDIYLGSFVGNYVLVPG
jgi:hypothetical protein